MRCDTSFSDHPNNKHADSIVSRILYNHLYINQKTQVAAALRCVSALQPRVHILTPIDLGCFSYRCVCPKRLASEHMLIGVQLQFVHYSWASKQVVEGLRLHLSEVP